MTEVTIFENPNFQGRSVSLPQGGHQLTSADDLNDAVSSLQVPAGMVAVVYESANDHGGAGMMADFMEDCADLSVYALAGKISYVSVSATPLPSGLAWARGRYLDGVYVAGHWERPPAGGILNPPAVTVSPALLPHLLDISTLAGAPWQNPAVDTSSPTWSSDLVGAKTFDGSNDHALEWVSVTTPTLEQDDQIGLAGFALDPEVSANDLPFTHPFGPDYEFTIVPDDPFLNLLAPQNRDPNGPYASSWTSAAQLGVPAPAGVLALEVDAAIVPEQDRITHGDRVAVFGRWIVDAGHPDFHTEIHPPLLMARARVVDALGVPVPPTPEAETLAQFWSRPYQAAQRFIDGDSTGLCLQDYIKSIVTTIGRITAYPPIFAKPFDGVHLASFTVRPPLPSPPSGTAGPQQLQCSYHFTVNGSCSVQVIPSPAEPNAVLVLLALNSIGYPTLPEPPSHTVSQTIGSLLAEAEKVGVDVSTLKKLFWFEGQGDSDPVDFRVFSAPSTSAQDSIDVVPFTPLASVPGSVQVTDPTTPFPVRGWVRLRWSAGFPHSATGAAGAAGALTDLQQVHIAKDQQHPAMTKGLDF
jgi:hypothetical protein